jgi:hypothetical protein
MAGHTIFKVSDNLNPRHYRTREIECIEVTGRLDFCTGNAIKYMWRAGLKGDKDGDLNKAVWYLWRAINYDLKPREIAFDLARIEDYFEPQIKEAMREIWNASRDTPDWKVHLLRAVEAIEER